MAVDHHSGITFARRVVIYAWLCPHTGKPVYVGKTSQPLEVRMRSHYREARVKASTQKHHWLLSIMNDGLRVGIMELETCSVPDSSYVEREWIAILRERFRLLNEVSGGCGNPGVGRVKWTPEALARLGTVNDDVLAEELGCNAATVAYRRRVLSIPRCPGQPLPSSTITLSPETIAQLGTRPDYAIAAELGISKFVVAKHRRRLGIIDCATATGHDGRIKSGAPHRRWPELPAEAVPFLGTDKDRIVAERFGVSEGVIRGARARNGIPRFHGAYFNRVGCGRKKKAA